MYVYDEVVHFDTAALDKIIMALRLYDLTTELRSNHPAWWRWFDRFRTHMQPRSAWVPAQHIPGSTLRRTAEPVPRIQHRRWKRRRFLQRLVGA